MVYYGMEKRLYQLGDSLNSGGEGTIYQLKNAPQLVAKVYSEKRLTPRAGDPDPRRTLCEKLRIMLKQPIAPYIGQVLTVAWPQDILFDATGNFVGYVMPNVAGGHHLCAACRQRERTALFPNYTFKTAVTVAYNLALAVQKVHECGAVIGDLNVGNVMVNADGHITLVDTDSYGITDRITGRTYPCEVAVDEVLAPELLFQNARAFSVQTDRFTLAIHLFTLLMNNCHPFSVPDPTVSSASDEPVADNIRRGYCPYLHSGPEQCSQDAPDIRMLPPDIRELFRRAFDYNERTVADPQTTARRPTAREWKCALYDLHKSKMEKCKKGHVYPASGYPCCPWCEVEQRRVQPPIHHFTDVASSQPYRYQPPQPAPPVGHAVGQRPRKPAAYRSAVLLWGGCIAAGALLGPQLDGLFLSIFKPHLTVVTLQMLLRAAGIVAGCIIAYNAQDAYRLSTGWFGWALLCLFVPVLGVVLTAVGLLAWALLVLVAKAVLYALFIVGLLCIFAKVFGG